MLHPGRVAQALDERREAFRAAGEEAARLLARYHQALDELVELPLEGIEVRLAEDPWPGARPTEELEERGLIIPFEERWNSAQEARAWALERLQGTPIVAVDGSQIAASKEFGVPLSLVQVAWFENYHDPAHSYRKDVRNEIVAPGEQVEEIEEYAFAESKLNQRRFALEMRVAVERIVGVARERPLHERPPHERPLRDDPPLVLIDGSFVLSFIGRMAPAARPAYLQALFGLLDASREKRVPVVGYVDLSFASDLLTMLRILFDLPASTLFDARVLAARMGSFDRTAAFQCARGDVLPHYVTTTADYSRDMCFLYLKTGQDRFPARLDFPRWILDADPGTPAKAWVSGQVPSLLDRVVDLVRAEVVVGCGYPYALETADAAAVLTAEDRMSFYRLFHEFARANGIQASLPGKSISKLHRR